jgi:hypothetical protein
MEQKNYEACIKTCTEAIDVGRQAFADYKLISRYEHASAIALVCVLPLGLPVPV